MAGLEDCFQGGYKTVSEQTNSGEQSQIEKMAYYGRG